MVLFINKIISWIPFSKTNVESFQYLCIQHCIQQATPTPDSTQNIENHLIWIVRYRVENSKQCFIVLKMCIRCVLLSNAVYLFWIPNQIARRYEELLLSGDVYAINQLEKNYASSGNSSQISLSESDVNSKAGGNSGPASANQKGRWLQINRTNLVEC